MNGKKIKEYRERSGMSVAELAYRLGTHSRTIERWESDEFRPMPVFQTGLAKIFKNLIKGG